MIKILTSTGTAFEHEIPVATQSPRPDARYFLTFALIGLYVGVIPVALGLLWFPLASRIGPTGLDILLALTVGLLAFLLIDTIEEGLEAVSLLPSSFQGLALFIAAAAGAWLGLDLVGSWLKGRRPKNRTAGTPGAVVALLVAVGIGLHNLGEGLAIGAAFALGEAALGTLLIIGFMLHNTTEGLAIIAPIARERPSLLTLARLGAIGGVPTIAGAWLGGLVYSPVAAVLCLGLGAGAIGQVIHLVARQMAGSGPCSRGLRRRQSRRAFLVVSSSCMRRVLSSGDHVTSKIPVCMDCWRCNVNRTCRDPPTRRVVQLGRRAGNSSRRARHDVLPGRAERSQPYAAYFPR